MVGATFARVSARWLLVTALGSAAGVALGTTVIGGSTDRGGLIALGLVAGGVVGAAQAPILSAVPSAQVLWTLVTAGAWGLGWATTTAFGIEVERGYYTFGATGAVVATLLTGAALQAVVDGAYGRQMPPQRRHHWTAAHGTPRYGG